MPILLRSHERDSQIERATEADKAAVIQFAQDAKKELEKTIILLLQTRFPILSLPL